MKTNDEFLVKDEVNGYHVISVDEEEKLPTFNVLKSDMLNLQKCLRGKYSFLELEAQINLYCEKFGFRLKQKIGWCPMCEERRFIRKKEKSIILINIARKQYLLEKVK